MPTSDTNDPRADIDEMLADLATLDEDDVWYLAELWQAEDAAARQRSWAKAKKRIEATGREPLLAEVRGAVGSWMKAGQSDFSGIHGLLGTASAATGGRQAAAPAIIDAAAAILAGDSLDRDEEDVLLRPWDTMLEDEGGDDDEPADAEDGQSSA